MTTTQSKSLSEELTHLAAELANQIPPDVQTIMKGAERQLADSGVASQSLKVGDRVPNIVLPNAVGRTVQLEELLKQGPIVLSFYRGSWCPYCNLELRGLQSALPQFEEYGASLVAISPETPDHSLSSVDKHSLTFEVLSDQGNRVARQFGLVFELPLALRPVYEQFGIDVPAHNGDESFELPIPATYVIDPSGIIQFAFVNVDYKQRAEPSDLIAALASTGAGR